MPDERKITVVTGARSEYGILFPVMKEIKSTKNLKLSVIVTGMHLSHEFGFTIDDIKRDGFKIDEEVDMLLSGDTRLSMVKSLGIGIIGIAQALETIDPDIVLVCGDRSEPFAAAVSASYLSKPVAHLHAGDAAKGSNIDDSIRFAIAKFAHIHLAATEKQGERLIKLGEEPWRVHVVGSPTIDRILSANIPSRESVARDYSLDLAKPIALVVQHPTSIDAENAANEIRETMEAVRELELQSIVVCPNADAGGRAMIQVINEYQKYPFIKIFKSLPQEEYLALMSVASVIIGNSSSGIIEAPSFKLPAINIGIRQEGRERADNVIDVGYSKNEIVQSIKKALYDDDFRAKVKECKNPYGDGKSSRRIVKILSEAKVDTALLRKKMTY
jgi:UDP-N-acetylglucosamine 2-epimerase (non-hydrolysing)/GDP/UDP-N,N'-diacetylbacillosamine 2-epimerase (hydrolysing)